MILQRSILPNVAKELGIEFTMNKQDNFTLYNIEYVPNLYFIGKPENARRAFSEQSSFSVAIKKDTTAPAYVTKIIRTAIDQLRSELLLTKMAEKFGLTIKIEDISIKKEGQDKRIENKLYIIG